MKKTNAPLIRDDWMPQMQADETMPAGPYRLGLTAYGDRFGPPWTILAANGQCLAGWIDSRDCAVGIMAALNLQYPA